MSFLLWSRPMTERDRQAHRALEGWARQTNDAAARYYEAVFFNRARDWEIVAAFMRRNDSGKS